MPAELQSVLSRMRELDEAAVALQAGIDASVLASVTTAVQKVGCDVISHTSLHPGTEACMRVVVTAA